MQRFLERVWYGRSNGWALGVVLFPLWILSRFFALGAALRRHRLLRAGRQARVDARVISVGNLCVGGAGKTPVAILIANRLAARGLTPAVVSRGYGRTGKGTLVVSDRGNLVVADPGAAGDEPLLLARACPGASVLVGVNRVEAARLAAERHGARAIVLDDGFQHLRLARDLDIVVIDASNPFGNGHLLPLGPLREGRESLSRAQLGWLTKVDQAETRTVDDLAEEVRQRTGREPVRSVYQVTEIFDGGWGRLGTDALRGERCLLLSGIARPGSFRQTLEALGARVEQELLFPDHHRFSQSQLAAARRRARAQGLALVMTEKDAVRIRDLAVLGPTRVVRVEAVIVAGESALAEVL